MRILCVRIWYIKGQERERPFMYRLDSHKRIGCARRPCKHVRPRDGCMIRVSAASLMRLRGPTWLSGLSAIADTPSD